MEKIFPNEVKSECLSCATLLRNEPFSFQVAFKNEESFKEITRVYVRVETNLNITLISEYFEAGKNKKSKLLKQAEKYAKSSSEAEKVAQKAERDSIDIKKAEYMESRVGEVFDGTISNVTNFGVYVELENTIEGLIRFENLGLGEDAYFGGRLEKEYFIYDDDHKCLIGERSRKVYKVGDKITVRVIEANKLLRRISFAEILE